jgi:hypothetical protein
MSETARRKKTSVKTVNAILDAFWEIDESSSRPRGLIAMEFLYRDNPEAWLKFVGTYLPRELMIENTLAEVDDDTIDDMILRIRQKVEDERGSKAIEAERAIGQLEFKGPGSDLIEVGGGEEPAHGREASAGQDDSPEGDDL